MTIVVDLLLIETTATWQGTLSVTLGTTFVLLMGLSRAYLRHHWLTLREHPAAATRAVTP